MFSLFSTIVSPKEIGGFYFTLFFQNRQLKEDFTNLQKLSGTEHTDLHNANV